MNVNFKLKRWMVCFTLSPAAFLFSYWMAHAKNEHDGTALILFYVLAMMVSGVAGIGLTVMGFSDLWEYLDE